MSTVIHFFLFLSITVICAEKESTDRLRQLEIAVSELQRQQVVLQEQLVAHAQLTETLRAETKWQTNMSAQKDVKIAQLENRVRELEVELGAVKSRTEFTETLYNTSTLKLNEQRNKRQLAASESTAFHAVCGANGEMHHVGLNHNIIFNTVTLNINNAYKAQQGVFVAPTAGIYVFSTSVLDAGSSPVIHADLMRNGVTMARAYGHGSDGYPEQGSVTVVMQLVQGDEVSVRLTCCSDGSITAMKYTSFTGALLMYM